MTTPPSSHDDLLVVLPTYNEAANIEGLVRELAQLYPGVRLLVIDDNSPDGTGAVVDRLHGEILGLQVVHRAGKLGLGSAHILGLERAIEHGCRLAVTMDCDYTHRPKDLQLLLDALAREGADVAIGSRYLDAASMQDWPLPRRVITRTAHMFTRHLLGIPGDATSGFRLYRTDALARVPFRQVPGSGYSFIFELLFVCLECGLKVAEVPVLTPIRQSGESKISRVEVLRALKTLARLARRRLRRASRAGAALC